MYKEPIDPNETVSKYGTITSMIHISKIYFGAHGNLKYGTSKTYPDIIITKTYPDTIIYKNWQDLHNKMLELLTAKKAGNTRLDKTTIPALDEKMDL